MDNTLLQYVNEAIELERESMVSLLTSESNWSPIDDTTDKLKYLYNNQFAIKRTTIDGYSLIAICNHNTSFSNDSTTLYYGDTFRHAVSNMFDDLFEHSVLQ